MSVIGNGLRDAWQDFALPSWGGRAALDNPVVYPNHQPKVVSATPLRQVVQPGAWFH